MDTRKVATMGYLGDGVVLGKEGGKADGSQKIKNKHGCHHHFECL